MAVMEAVFLWVCAHAHICVNECAQGKALECIIQRWSELGFPFSAEPGVGRLCSNCSVLFGESEVFQIHGTIMVEMFLAQR